MDPHILFEPYFCQNEINQDLSNAPIQNNVFTHDDMNSSLPIPDSFPCGLRLLILNGF